METTETFVWLLVLTSVLYCVFALDDIFVDAVANFFELGPKKIDDLEKHSLKKLKEKRIAIIIPAWKEADVIARMVSGNSARIDYTNYHFFVGLYPNDPTSIAKIAELTEKDPRIQSIINPKPGPTSKGQMLNVVVREILNFEKANGIEFDGFLMQDAEDIIHPFSLKVLNREMDRADFLQVPVFSLPVPNDRLVAGVYADEFAESHLKELLVREQMKAAIPSAGVGTLLSRALVLHFLRTQGELFNQNTVTEDYDLGIRAHQRGFRPHVVCHYLEKADGTRDYVATREYFPRHFQRSIRQKTRWTVGITFQGWKNLGWCGTLSNRYFLYRDRRGLVSNLVGMLGYFLAVVGLVNVLRGAEWQSQIFSNAWFSALVAANVAFMVIRFAQRLRYTSKIYGLRVAVFAAPRWPIGIVINALATVGAARQEATARLFHKPIAWAKTEHELPEMFGEAVHA